MNFSKKKISSFLYFDIRYLKNKRVQQTWLQWASLPSAIGRKNPFFSGTYEIDKLYWLKSIVADSAARAGGVHHRKFFKYQSQK